jgi:hypothetical protein
MYSREMISQMKEYRFGSGHEAVRNMKGVSLTRTDAVEEMN